MAKHKKHAKLNKIAPVDDGAVDDSPHVGSFRQRRTFGVAWPVAALFLVLAVTGGAGYWYVNRDDDSSKVQNKLDVTKDAGLFSRDEYQGLTSTQVQEKLKDDAGIDLRALEQRTLSAKDFKSFDYAYVVAQAWAGMSNYKKSLEAFAVAASMAPTNVSYEFYVAYSECAVLAEDKTKAKELIAKAKQALETDATVDTQVRKDLLQRLDDRLTFLDVEAGAPE